MLRIANLVQLVGVSKQHRASLGIARELTVSPIVGAGHEAALRSAKTGHGHVGQARECLKVALPRGFISGTHMTDLRKLRCLIHGHATQLDPSLSPSCLSRTVRTVSWQDSTAGGTALDSPGPECRLRYRWDSRLLAHNPRERRGLTARHCHGDDGRPTPSPPDLPPCDPTS